MKRIIYPLGLIMLMLVSLMSCKKEGIDIVNKNFNVRAKTTPRAKSYQELEQLTFNLSITGVDLGKQQGRNRNILLREE